MENNIGTGHKKLLIDNENIVDHIMPTISQEATFYGGIPIPNKYQIALVISALRMHPTMMYASEYDRSELGRPDKVDKYWPIQGSIGRFYRDTSHKILNEYLEKKKEGKNV